MKLYAPYILAALLAGAACGYYPDNLLLSGLSAFGSVMWLITAWQDHKLRQLNRTMETLKRWTE